MIGCVSIHTCEVDDKELALEQLTGQLSGKLTLKANTVGIIMCHPEFIDSGVLSYVANGLPFPVVGTTTSSQSTNDVVSEMVLTIFVMTADDVRFYVGRSECVDSGIDEPLSTALSKAPDSQPKLAIAFPPLLLKYPGDCYVESWVKAMPNVPVFGTLSVDDTLDFAGVKTICGSEVYTSCISFVLCYGNINPRFLISTLPKESALPYRGEITKATDHLVYEINDMPAVEYMRSMGFASDDNHMNVYWFVPFFISQRDREDFDGVPILRGFAEVDKDGTAIFRGKVDQGSQFTMLNMSNEFVMDASAETIGRVAEMENVNGLLAFSCIVRRMTLMNTNSCEELALAKNMLDDVPFMMGYAGGEICPTSIKDGVVTNRFHNFTMVVLVL